MGVQIFFSRKSLLFLQKVKFRITFVISVRVVAYACCEIIFSFQISNSGIFFTINFQFLPHCTCYKKTFEDGLFFELPSKYSLLISYTFINFLILKFILHSFSLELFHRMTRKRLVVTNSRVGELTTATILVHT